MNTVAVATLFAFADPGAPLAYAQFNKNQRPTSVGLWIFGGDEEDRTPDLRIANAALSQLSYVPTDLKL